MGSGMLAGSRTRADRRGQAMGESRGGSLTLEHPL